MIGNISPAPHTTNPSSNSPMAGGVWYRGITLAERVGLRQVTGSLRFQCERNRDRGRRHLAKWKAQPPFDSTALFQQRLKQWDLSESEFLGVLTEPGSTFDDAVVAAPAWVVELAEALRDVTEATLGQNSDTGARSSSGGAGRKPNTTSKSSGELEPDALSAPDEGLADGCGPSPRSPSASVAEPGSNGSRDAVASAPTGASLAQLRFLELVHPLTERAIRRLRERISHVMASHPVVPIEADGLEDLFVRLLPDCLQPILLRTMALELNVARLQTLLCGETAEERFESFIARIQQPQIRREFFREYPVLGRQIVTALETWLNCSLEFLLRWCADWSAIRATFAARGDPGPLVGIEGGEHVAFKEAPFYDPKAMQHERVIIGAFSTAKADKLPTGKTRVATIHLQATGDQQPRYEVQVKTAATVGGKKISVHANAEEKQRNENDKASGEK